MEITIGRTVLYRLSEFDAAAINHKWGNGAGNRMYEGEILPLIAARIWPDEYGPGVPGINGQLILDGPGTFWVTSRKEGTENGTWHWPPRV